jgi:predicted nucleic-acid-binding Zn-ribbon protein
MKQCTRCKKEKELNQFARAGYKADGSFKYRTVCKSCHAERVRYDQKIKGMTNNPERYSQCNDCCFIWSLNHSHDNCPKCGSHNLDRKNVFMAHDLDGFFIAESDTQLGLSRILNVSVSTIEQRIRNPINKNKQTWGDKYKFNVTIKKR